MEFSRRLGRAVVTVAPFVLACLVYLSLDAEDSHTDMSTVVLSWLAAHQDDMMIAALWLSGAWGLSRLVRHHLWTRLATRTDGTAPPKVLVQITSVVIYVTAIAGILGTLFGRDLLAALAAMSGIIGIVLGFALRSMILDLFMGLAINLERPFRIGDRILAKVQGTEVLGTVQEISWRCTHVLTTEHTVAIVPNREISGAVVINQAMPAPFYKLTVDVPIDESVPVERAVRVLEAALKDAAAQGGPVAGPVRVEAKAVSGAGVTYCCVFMHDYRKGSSVGLAKDAALRTILRHLHAAGLPAATERLFNIDAGTRPAAPEAGDLLKRVALFTPLTDDERAQLAAAAVLRDVPAGETLIHQGTEGETLFVVREGFLDALVDDRVVGHIAAGGLIGEMAMLTGEPRRATVRAASDTCVWEIGRTALAPLLEARPELMERLSEVAAARHRRIAAVNDPGTAASDRESRSILEAMATIFGRLRMAM